MSYFAKLLQRTGATRSAANADAPRMGRLAGHVPNVIGRATAGGGFREVEEERIAPAGEEGRIVSPDAGPRQIEEERIVSAGEPRRVGRDASGAAPARVPDRAHGLLPPERGMETGNPTFAVGSIASAPARAAAIVEPPMVAASGHSHDATTDGERQAPRQVPSLWPIVPSWAPSIEIVETLDEAPPLPANRTLEAAPVTVGSGEDVPVRAIAPASEPVAKAAKAARALAAARTWVSAPVSAVPNDPGVVLEPSVTLLTDPVRERRDAAPGAQRDVYDRAPVEELRVSIGRIEVTIEEPTASAPAAHVPSAMAPLRPAWPDRRLARHHLRG